MTQLTEDVFAVEVPDGRDAFAIESVPEEGIWELLCCNLSEYNEPTNEKYIRLPPGTWQLLSTTRTCTPSQAREITGEYLYPSIALAGMCKAKGLDANMNYVLLKKGE